MSSADGQRHELRLAYLTSQYPATSHTFIAREVEALRSFGVALDTFSIRPPSAAELEDDILRAEASRTFTVLTQPVAELILAQLQLLFRRPRTYLRVFALALRHRPPGLKGLLLSIAHFGEAIVLARELERRRITHLHNHFANPAATVGYLATRFLGLPWSFTIHGISETDYPAGLLLGRKVEAASFVACASNFGRAQAMRLVAPLHWSKLHVVRCGLRFDQLPSRAAVGGARLICVGRLSSEKGQAGLLQAFALVAADLSNVQLALVGDGPDADELRAITGRLGLGARVSFEGRLGELETIKQIAQSDILVLPSFMEGLPVVLMEAMAVGTPVIASRVAGIPELVRDGENGLLFTPSDWDELALCIHSLLKDRALCTRLAANGRERVAIEFDIRRSAERLLCLFRSFERS